MKKIKELKKEQGITLIALIITIILLAILAAVSVRAIYEMGIVNHAVNGTQKYAKEAVKENQMLDETGTLIEDTIDGIISILGDNPAPESDYIASLPTVVAGETATVTSKYISRTGSNEQIAIIPAGFTVSNIAKEKSISNGLVIYDAQSVADGAWTADTNSNSIPDVQENYNQFVWVPVETPYVTVSQLESSSAMLEYITELQEDIESEYDDGNGNIDTEFFELMFEMPYENFSKLSFFERYKIYNGDNLEAEALQSLVDAETPIYPMAVQLSDGNYRGILYDFSAGSNGSPEIKVKEISITYDYTEAYYSREPSYLKDTSSADGSSTLNPGIGESRLITQVKLQAEYNAMVESVAKNGGFYVARYELTTESSKRSTRGKTVATANDTASKDWYGLYGLCQGMYNSTTEKTQSMMITGAQYDQIMIWMKEERNTNTSTATNIKYYIIDSTGMGVYGVHSASASGSNLDYSVKQIFDLAGNRWEWTSEAFDWDNRVTYGSDYNYAGASRPASNYLISEPGNGIIHTSRPTLYIK